MANENTLLVTATAFDDRTMLSYSIHKGWDDSFTEIQQCEATAQAWWYLTRYLPEHCYDIGAVRICVIDRRPGTRATSRCCGHSLTS